MPVFLIRRYPNDITGHNLNRSLALFLDENLLAPYPRLSEFMSTIEGLAGVSEYLANRPELIGVGTKPQLVIGGIPKPTGVVNE